MRGDERKQQHLDKLEENKSPEQKEHEVRMLQHGKHYHGDSKDKDNSSNKKNEDDSNIDSTNKPVQPPPVMQRPNLLFLEMAPPNSDNPDYTPSPCRKSNFDLVTLMTTQEAIHRVLNDPQRQARKSAEHGSNQFLKDFYVARLQSHFSGDQPYGRADDFLEELLDCPPRMITVGSGDGDSIRNGEDVVKDDAQKEDKDRSKKSLDEATKKKEDLKADAGGEGGDALTKDLTYLIDPVGIAETILNEREKVALEWQAQATEQTKEDHMKIQRLVLTKLMECSTVDECLVEDPPEIELAFTESSITNHTSVFE